MTDTVSESISIITLFLNSCRAHQRLQFNSVKDMGYLLRLTEALYRQVRPTIRSAYRCASRLPAGGGRGVGGIMMAHAIMHRIPVQDMARFA